jgi:transglutaminase-like putative cysteine protease
VPRVRWSARAGALLLAALACRAGARERTLPHPSDETEVFTGGEEVAEGQAARPPAMRYWKVRALLTVPRTSVPIHLGLLLPPSDARQSVLARRASAPGFAFRETQEPPNVRGDWSAERTSGGELSYDVAVRVAETTMGLPAVAVRDLVLPADAPDALAPSSRVQSTAPDVVGVARATVRDAGRLDEVVPLLYQYVAAFQGAGAEPGPQDAVAVLSARAGTTLGRARALVALLRASGVPARLVGGLRLSNTAGKRATNSWVEVWTGSGWFPLDPAGGFYGTLPTTYLALYRGDLPLVVHTAGVAVDYAFGIRETTRRAVEEPDADDPVAVGGGRRNVARGRRRAGETHAAYVAEPVASVVLIADRTVPAAVTDRILGEAREAAIDCVLLTAPFESRFFREAYLERLIAANLAIIRQANLVLVATVDDAGAYSLLTLGERGVRVPDARIVVAGEMAQPSALMLGSLLYHLVGPGEVVLVRHQTELLPLWEVARANLIDGTPMTEEAQRWGLETLVLGEAGEHLPRWRRPLLDAWSRIVRAQVPLSALTLILVLPLIATIVVVARIVVGLETFGMFGPVIVALAFLTTGLWWGTLIFVVIVGLGVLLRSALQRLRLQAVARLAILIALVSAVMGGLTGIGAALGVGPLLNISIFPMIIMSNVIESFAASQVEFGTAQAVRMTVSTLFLSMVCYLAVDRTGVQALVLAYPEILLATVVLDVLLGKWRGLRLLEYVRFWRAVGTRAPADESPRP